MGDLRAHAANDLVIFNRDKTTARFDCGSDGVEIDAVDEWIVDDGGVDALRDEFLSSFDGFAEQGAAADQDNVVAALQNLRFAPFVGGVFRP